VSANLTDGEWKNWTQIRPDNTIKSYAYALLKKWGYYSCGKFTILVILAWQVRIFLV